MDQLKAVVHHLQGAQLAIATMHACMLAAARPILLPTTGEYLQVGH